MFLLCIKKSILTGRKGSCKERGGEREERGYWGSRHVLGYWARSPPRGVWLIVLMYVEYKQKMGSLSVSAPQNRTESCAAKRNRVLNATNRGGVGQAWKGQGGARKGVTVESCLPSVLFDVDDNCKSNASIIDERMKEKKKRAYKNEHWLCLIVRNCDLI